MSCKWQNEFQCLVYLQVFSLIFFNFLMECDSRAIDFVQCSVWGWPPFMAKCDQYTVRVPLSATVYEFLNIIHDLVI